MRVHLPFGKGKGHCVFIGIIGVIFNNVTSKPVSWLDLTYCWPLWSKTVNDSHPCNRYCVWARSRGSRGSCRIPLCFYRYRYHTAVCHTHQCLKYTQKQQQIRRDSKRVKYRKWDLTLQDYMQHSLAFISLDLDWVPHPCTWSGPQ